MALPHVFQNKVETVYARLSRRKGSTLTTHESNPGPVSPPVEHTGPAGWSGAEQITGRHQARDGDRSRTSRRAPEYEKIQAGRRRRSGERRETYRAEDQ